MRYIKKKDNEPEDLKVWRVEVKEDFEHLVQKGNTRKLWNLMKNVRGTYSKSRLRAHLIKEQNYICCYCGQRITLNKNNTVLEHLMPKAKYRNLVYDYDNILLSCTGGSRNIIHKLEPGESIDSVAKTYGVTREYLEAINVEEAQIKHLRKKYDLENIKEGDRLIIIQKVKGGEQHCDTKKRGHELLIHPLQADCEHQFRYNSFNGHIREISLEVKDTIKKLGLNNNTYLVQQRKRTIDAAYLKLSALLEQYGKDKEQFHQARKKLVERYEKPDPETGMLPPFAFVTKAVLKYG